MEIYTIGFTKKTAAEFFERSARGNPTADRRRLNNTSQLAGFAKRDDLEYFLREICGADYYHEPRWPPRQEILDAYKKKHISWEEYAPQYVDLLVERRRRTRRPPAVRRAGGVLVQRTDGRSCHRRLAAEYLAEHGAGEVVHL